MFFFEHIFYWISTSLNKITGVPLHPAGQKFVVPAAIMGTASLLLAPWWINVYILPVAVIIIAFFRHPARAIPKDLSPYSILSPADGTITDVDDIMPPAELGLVSSTPFKRLRVFLSPMDVHVNRIPLSGTVKKILCRPGRKASAYASDTSDYERNTAVVQGLDGFPVIFTQIAGNLARRIISYLKLDEEVEAGIPYGIITFGSRVDVWVPAQCRITVKLYEKVTAGETVLALWPESQRLPEFTLSFTEVDTPKEPSVA